MNPPRKHHYVPAFYLKQWAGTDERVCEMRKWPRGVADRRKHPNATGFKEDLYCVKGVPREYAQRFESTFLKLVDSHADCALQKHLKPDEQPWDIKLVRAWALFIMSLMYRNPEAVTEIRDHIISLWRAAIEHLPEAEQYRFERDYQHVMHIGASNFLQNVINSERFGLTITSFGWCTISLHRSDRTLLTSDRPLHIPHGFDNSNAYIALPVGPDKLFVAAKKRDTIDRLLRMRHTDVVRAMNRSTVGQAREYVWGVNASQLAFVQKRICTFRDRVIITPEAREESLAAVRTGPKFQLAERSEKGLSRYWQSKLEQVPPASLWG